MAEGKWEQNSGLYLNCHECSRFPFLKIVSFTLSENDIQRKQENRLSTFICKLRYVLDWGKNDDFKSLLYSVQQCLQTFIKYEKVIN